MKNRIILSIYTFWLITLAVPATASDLQGIHIPMSAVFKALRHDFGSMRGNYITPDSLVSEQVIEALEAKRPNVQLPNGNYLISGCRVHSCDEKAAVIVTQSGAIMASALINFHCYAPRFGSVECDKTPRLTIFLESRGDDMILSRALEGWARSQASIGAIEKRTLH